MVFAKMVLNENLYAQLSGWIHVALAVGLAGMVSTLMLARFLVDRPITSPFLLLRRIIDDLAGRSPVRATRQLKDATTFTRD